MSPDNPSSTVSLQSALHTVTRTHHTNLNKTITARLPLCLPPYASDPTAYYFGILMFGHIFLAFEEAVNKVADETPSSDETRARHIQILKTTSTEGLPRAEALQRDFHTLSDRLQLRNPGIMSVEARVREQALESTRQILRNIESKPHLALAYKWTMYLAMFNGGRWLYKQLASPGPDFWLEPKIAEHDENTIQALSFWRFETSSQDPQAEELKSEFKEKFEEASAMLTDGERDEVVSEAVELFKLCLKLIDGLDVIMAEVNQGVQQGFTQAMGESGNTEPGMSTGVVNMVWQTLSSNFLASAYRVLNSGWARPIREEVKAAD